MVGPLKKYFYASFQRYNTVFISCVLNLGKKNNNKHAAKNSTQLNLDVYPPPLQPLSSTHSKFNMQLIKLALDINTLN